MARRKFELGDEVYVSTHRRKDYMRIGTVKSYVSILRQYRVEFGRGPADCGFFNASELELAVKPQVEKNPMFVVLVVVALVSVEYLSVRLKNLIPADHRKNCY